MSQQQAEPSNAGREQSRLPRWVRIAAIGRNPKATLVRVTVLVITCFVTFKFILLPIRIEGISMLPTYKDRSVNLINRLAYVRQEPQRGDVVSIRFDREETNELAGIPQAAGWLKTPHVMLLKRIVGLPGETVAFENGRVLINGEVLDEPYEKAPCDWNRPPVKVGPDEYFVVGDNRTMPWEGHVFGRALRSQIIGKVIL
ncbi:MAG: signal peptidase I [Limisphaerales bacterium]